MNKKKNKLKYKQEVQEKKKKKHHDIINILNRMMMYEL